MSKAKTALARWNQLDGRRQSMLRRFERYASVTIPKVCLPPEVNPDTDAIQYDWQSFGAQCVNHLVNKMAMALFNPGRPFFRMEPDDATMRKLAAAGVTEAVLREALVGGEQKAIKVLDKLGVRPKLYEVLRHLIITGNVMLDTSTDDNIRVHSVRRYVAKRNCNGALIELLMAEKLLVDELEPAVYEWHKANGPKASDTNTVTVLKWCQFDAKKKRWNLTQWIEDKQLPDEHSFSYSVEDFPYHVLTWDLADDHDYGTGLVEECSGDFNAVSVLSESEVKSAVMASEFRWLADPSGITDVNDFKQSQNGDVLPGREKDLTPVYLQNAAGLKEISAASDKLVRRLGSVFLLASATVRDAERVTAEEVRQQIAELESSLGGVYSRIAVDFQGPLARWLLKKNGISIQGTALVPVIVTGLDALSRSADSTNLIRALTDLGGIATLPPAVQARLQIGPIVATVFSAYGLQPSMYIKPEQQVAQEAQAAAQAQNEQVAQQSVAQEGAKALATNATQQGQPQQ